MRSRLARPTFCSMSDSDIGKTLPFAQITRASVMPGGLDRVEHRLAAASTTASGGTGCR
jgi:hypothetical protein